MSRCRQLGLVPRSCVCLVLVTATACFGHGTVVEPISRVYRVFLSDPENPNFPLAETAVEIDGTQAYFAWDAVVRNIPEAVKAGLPPGFDYSPWLPDGQIASAGRVDPDSQEYSFTYAGLDQVSPDWPTTAVNAGETITVDFFATVPHDSTVWDAWMTNEEWDANSPLTWDHMEFLGRPEVTLLDNHYYFDLQIPADRSGHHVLWVAWQLSNPGGGVFFSTSDLLITANLCEGDANGDGSVDPLDSGYVLARFGCPVGTGDPDCDSADQNGDGAVDPLDSGFVLARFGTCP